MLYPDPDNIASPSCYVVIDFLRPHLCANDIIVPIYPISGDMIRVRGDDDDVWLAHVLSINLEHARFTSLLKMQIIQADTRGNPLVVKPVKSYIGILSLNLILIAGRVLIGPREAVQLH